MTRQQAGVSAEAVAKLLERIALDLQEVKASHLDWVGSLVHNTDPTQQQLEYDKHCPACVIKQVLEAIKLNALATAPPEQASEPFSSRALSALAECTAKKMQSIWERAIFDKQNGWQVIADLFNANRHSAISERLETQFVDVAPAAGNEALTTKPNPPQAASSGARNQNYLDDLRHDLQDEDFRFQYLAACAADSEGALRNGIKDVLDAALAAHDQKVRNDVLEEAALAVNGVHTGYHHNDPAETIGTFVRRHSAAIQELIRSRKDTKNEP